MNRLLCITAGALLLSSLGACTADNDELIQWMEQQHKEIKPNIAPIYPPKKFDPQPYLGVTGVEPFGTQKLIPVGGASNGKGSALLAAAKAHATQELAHAQPHAHVGQRKQSDEREFSRNSWNSVTQQKTGMRAHALFTVSF